MASGPAHRARGACDAAYCGRETDEARACRLSRSDAAAPELAGVCTSALVMSGHVSAPSTIPGTSVSSSGRSRRNPVIFMGFFPVCGPKNSIHRPNTARHHIGSAGLTSITTTAASVDSRAILCTLCIQPEQVF